jgi:hypothetical protein
LRSGDPGNPIENVFNEGLFCAFNYLCRRAAINEESIPPLSKAAIGL